MEQSEKLGQLDESLSLSALLLGERLTAVLLVQKVLQPGLNRFWQPEARDINRYLDRLHGARFR
jgi:hypothetical protein